MLVTGPHAQTETFVPLPGSERQPAPGAQTSGPTDPSQSIEVTIYLRPRTAAGELAAQAAAMGAQPPRQRTYLTPDQFSTLYGANPADIEKVVAFARNHGLRVVSTSAARRIVTVSGTAHALETAFHVELKQYTSLYGPYRGCSGPVQIPIEMRHIIEGVFGLDDREQASWMLVGASRESLFAADSGSVAGESTARSGHGAFRWTAFVAVLTALVIFAALIALLR